LPYRRIRLAAAASRAALAAAVIASQVAVAAAETKTLAGRPDANDPDGWETFATGFAGPSTLTGSAFGDVIFGDPAATAGGPVSLRRIVWGVGPNGETVEPNGYVQLSTVGNPVSPDGRFVVVESAATNLVKGGFGGGGSEINVFLIDLRTGAATPLSKTAAGVVGNGSSGSPSFSPDGAWVIYESIASNITGSSVAQIVVRNLATGAQHVVSRSRTDGALADGASYFGRFTPDGQAIVFESAAKNLIGAGLDDDGFTDIFAVRFSPATGVVAGTTTKISTGGNGGSIGMMGHSAAAVSPRGDAVTFTAPDTSTLGVVTDQNTGDDVLYKRFDTATFAVGPLLTGDLRVASTTNNGDQGTACSSGVASFAPDGRTVVFASTCETLAPGETANMVADVYGKSVDLDNLKMKGKITRLSEDKALGDGNNFSSSPVVSPDGGLLAFKTAATNLVAGATNGTIHLALRPMTDQPATLSLLSRVPGGAQADTGVVGPAAFLPDGSGTLFTSDSKTLGGPSMMHQNLFLATLPAGPAGDDTISGGAGDDRLFGAGGNDTLVPGAGYDVLHGGPGNDTLQEGEVLVGGSGDDTYVDLAAGATVIEHAGEGTDTIRAGITVTLPANVERLVLTGSAAVNGTGNALSNRLTGNSARNGLDGGAGNDRLTGGRGADGLTGGSGKDRFVYLLASDSTAKRSDTITDFAAEDTIDLAAIDANTKRKGSQRFLFIGKAAFKGRPGELRVVKKGSSYIVAADRNGDRKTDFRIVVRGARPKLGDFAGARKG
jgi:Ca2+-binding RTX toxin-like protein